MADPLHGPNEPKAPSSPWPPLRPTHTRRRAVARLLLLTGAVALVCGLVYTTHRRHSSDITSNAAPQLRALRQLLGQDHHSSSPSRRHLPATPDPAHSADPLALFPPAGHRPKAKLGPPPRPPRRPPGGHVRSRARPRARLPGSNPHRKRARRHQPRPAHPPAKRPRTSLPQGGGGNGSMLGSSGEEALVAAPARWGVAAAGTTRLRGRSPAPPRRRCRRRGCGPSCATCPPGRRGAHARAHFTRRGRCG